MAFAFLKKIETWKFFASLLLTAGLISYLGVWIAVLKYIADGDYKSAIASGGPKSTTEVGSVTLAASDGTEPTGRGRLLKELKTCLEYRSDQLVPETIITSTFIDPLYTEAATVRRSIDKFIIRNAPINMLTAESVTKASNYLTIVMTILVTLLALYYLIGKLDDSATIERVAKNYTVEALKTSAVTVVASVVVLAITFADFGAIFFQQV